MIKLLITDFDDTLYSWLGFFVPAFYEMVDELSAIIGIEKGVLLREYKAVHQSKGSVEYPFATLLLPSVNKVFSNCTQQEVLKKLDPAFHRFYSARKRLLKLYPTVQNTLQMLCSNEIRIVGYTESAEENGVLRLKKLNIDQYFSHVYVADSQYERPAHIRSSDKTYVVHGKKPNAEILSQILKDEDCAPEEAIYVGDSLTKDIYMAKKAGVTAVLFKPPVLQDAQLLYNKLVAISSWTDRDFEREKTLKAECHAIGIQPDYIINDYIELVRIIDKINQGVKYGKQRNKDHYFAIP